MVYPECAKKNGSRSCAIALGDQRREFWHAVGHLRKHCSPFHSVEGVGTVDDSELRAAFVPSVPHIHSSGHGDSILPHLSIDLQPPRPSLLHSSWGDGLPPRHAHAIQSTVFPRRSEARLQEELSELRCERARFVHHSSSEGCYAPVSYTHLTLPTIYSV